MENNSDQRDPRLWEIARKRASFKSTLISYFIINAFLWALWYFTNGKSDSNYWPWPLWVTLGWGVGLVFQFFGAYVYPEANSAESEYEKMKRKQAK
jgi:sterol desaturase/sphingolipid hydroxylase (fatty acid hydroxylase superfamily)